MLQIGEVATRVGLSLRTIRHWDEVGLVVPSERTAGGFRLYTEADVERLLFIKTLKPLEFSIDQIRELLTVIDDIRADDGTDEEHTAQLQGRLAMFRAAADSRTEVLRGQVHSLESLSRTLKSMSRTSSRGRAVEPH